MSQDFEVYINMTIYKHCKQFLCVKSINTVKSHTSETTLEPVPIFENRRPRCELNINKHYEWENSLKKAIKVAETWREKVCNKCCTWQYYYIQRL
jgi:hypothetical protein